MLTILSAVRRSSGRNVNILHQESHETVEDIVEDVTEDETGEDVTVEDVENVTEDDTVEDVTDGGENTVTANCLMSRREYYDRCYES